MTKSVCSTPHAFQPHPAPVEYCPALQFYQFDSKKLHIQMKDSVWLILLNVMSSRFIHVFANGWVFFLFYDCVVFHCIYVCKHSVYTHNVSFLRVPLDLWVVFLSWLLRTMLQWTWECRHLLEILISLPLQAKLEVRVLDHMVVLFLSFWETSTLFAIEAVHSHQQDRSFSLSLPLPTLVIKI